MREKVKNRILLIIICFFTIVILIVSLKLNDNRIKNDLSLSQLEEYLTEINYEEISDYIIEQPSIIIYVSNSSKQSDKKFENLLKPIIRKYNLENDIVYINTNDTTIIDPIYQNSPELVIYKDGEITDIVDCTTLRSKKSIIKLLKERGVIND